jgi:transposase-like protein
MRYPASEKIEIIRLVEQSHLSVRETLERIGIPRATFYRGYDLYQSGGPEALEDRRPQPKRVWNRIPDAIRQQIIQLALDEPELSPRELAVRFTDQHGYFVSEASVYRLLKAQDLIASPAFIVMKAANEFKDKTSAPNQLWQTDFTYLKVIGWGWFYLSPVLDDFSRYILAWKLCSSMKTEDVTDTLKLALQASGLEQAEVVHRPRLLSDNGSSYISSDLAGRQGHDACAWGAVPSHDPGQDRALAPDAQEPHPARELRPAGRSGGADRSGCGTLQPQALPRELEQSHASRRLLRSRQDHSEGEGKDQTTNHPKPPLAAPDTGRIIFNPDGPEAPLDQTACRLKNPDNGQSCPFWAFPHTLALIIPAFPAVSPQRLPSTT